MAAHTRQNGYIWACPYRLFAKRITDDTTTAITWNLVGSGEAYPTCSDFSTWSIRCLTPGEGHTNRAINRDCHRLSCPECFDGEVWRRSQSAAETLAYVKKRYYMAGVLPMDYVEVIIYPPMEKREWCFHTQEGYEWMKDQLKAIHNDYGVLGGVQVTHITAVNRDNKATYAEYEKLRRGLPAEVRYNPHVQEVALRRPDWGRKRSAEAKWTAAGWFIRVLYADGRTHNRAWNSVAKKIAYEMSHAYQGKTATGRTKTFTTWFGICSYNNVQKKLEVTKEPELCKCGQQCWLFMENDRVELAFRKVRTYTFFLEDSTIDRAVLKYQLDRGPERRAEDLAAWIATA